MSEGIEGKHFPYICSSDCYRKLLEFMTHKGYLLQWRIKIPIFTLSPLPPPPPIPFPSPSVFLYQVLLNGNASSDDKGIVSYQWTKLSDHLACDMVVCGWVRWYVVGRGGV